MHLRPFRRWTCIVSWAAISLCAQPPRPRSIDFQREIRPLLAENCFQCHGPDSSSRMAELRLDLKSAAFQPGKRGAALVAGNPAQSLLYQRITEPSPARRMPPAISRKSLTPAHVDLLKRWIELGAPWSEHWAFKAPLKPAPPAVANPTWTRNAIDRFILARLEARKLAPAPEAGRRTLIRRAALDLTGLPPKPAEIETFLKDLSPGAYERMLDRYLASPHFGEHRARYWLDAARYGDTHGIHIDNYREVWPYRDWVIQAFNRNLPFDQFTLEQLAGDLLPSPTLDQRIATGFHRCNVTTNEAGIIEDEYAEIYAKDRADTTAAIWLGLTTGCATCHDHKFDPITQKDFYSLGAFFRNTVQKVMDDNIPNTPPVIVVPRLEDRAKWDKLTASLAAIQTAMQAERDASTAALEEWIRTRARVAAYSPLEEKAETFHADLAALAAKAAANAGPVKLGDSPVAGRQALHFAKAEGVNVTEAPQLDPEKPFTISVGFFFPKAEQGYTIAGRQNPRDRGRGWVVDVGARVAGLRLTGEEGRSIEIRAGHLEQLTHGTWNHLVISYDGSRHQSGLSLYLNGRAIPTQGRGNTTLELRGSLSVDNPLVLGRNLPHGAISDFRIFDREVTEAEAALLAQWPAVETALLKDAGELSPEDRSALATYYLQKHHQPFLQLAAEQKKLAGEARLIARRGAITHVMQERADQPAFAHVLYRGAYDQHRARVEANTPAVLPPMRIGLPRNRLGFARWLFAEENPLTARVTVNRLWQEIFGTGLVKTADDFGSQGEPPSHPELLDWLAVDFRESEWDLKRFYKQLLMSAAYRQAAQATPAKLAADPENRLLSRGPRFRLDAEMVRDYALAAAGLLAPQIGGPSVRPYQPDGIWEAVAMLGSNTRFYQRDSGDGLYRRSLYTFWKRSAPPASMEIFNAPTRESCTVRRERTNTPLQALVTMNDPQFVEAARVLAERALAEASTFEARLDLISTRLLARTLTIAERRIARQSYEGYRQHYEAQPGDAATLLETGARKADPSLPRAEYAAFTLLANQLLNLDEVFNK